MQPVAGVAMTDTTTLVLLKTGDVICLYDGISWRLPCVQNDSRAASTDMVPGSRPESVIQTTTNHQERQRRIFVRSPHAKAL